MQPDPDELIAHGRSELARFKIPAYVLFTIFDALPLTASRKVQRFVLGERAVDQLGLELADD